jgi:hypothetical protein
LREKALDVAQLVWEFPAPYESWRFNSPPLKLSDSFFRLPLRQYFKTMSIFSVILKIFSERETRAKSLTEQESRF